MSENEIEQKAASTQVDPGQFAAEALERVRSSLVRIEQMMAAAEAAKTSAQEYQAQAAALVTELQARQRDVADVVTGASAAEVQITSHARPL